MQQPRFIAALEAGQPQKLVVFGTSLSFHLAPHLRDALKERFGDLITVQNSGMAAKASRSGLDELENKVLRYVPDAVTLEFAVNDAYSYEEFPDGTRDKGITLDESRANLEQLIARIQAALPDCEIVLLTMNPAFDPPTTTAWPAKRRPELGDFYRSVREVAEARGLELLDLNQFWKQIEAQEPQKLRELIPDGVHPNPRAIKSVLVPQIAREMGFDISGDLLNAK